MWNYASNCIAGSFGHKNNDHPSPSLSALEFSDDENSSIMSREQGLECPICYESFNIVENVPYVLWCGHTLCKNCILGLQWAVVKFPTLPLQLPLFISCPWCNLLSLRLIYRGTLRFPRKNFFLLWMLEGMNGDRSKSHSTAHGGDQPPVSSCRGHYGHFSESSVSDQDHIRVDNHLTIERLQSSIQKSLVFFVHLTAKFPLVLIFLLIVLYVVPASAAILALYILVTILFAMPSFMILYFAYPSLDWLVREIID